ncbi:carbon-nitrogen hydrolase family protein [Streptomyces sp. HNM0575]|uniref:nitrilase-related carbon-nitrogen hydrolase n=1 Tax=Streptomyces sp. HNM0575 TaxID=2716338 RepID=UPI00145E8A35|nr:carbon-nitrogen hydrolase family protein [Streptomyces sp. HNM0575]
MTTLRTALCQFTASTDPEDNLRTIDELAARAAGEGARLAVFPEAAMARFGIPLGPVAQPLDGPWADAVRETARRHRLTVVAGMFTPSPDGRVTNTLLATGPDVDTAYDKIHLYDAFGFSESDTVAPGEKVVTIDVEGVRVGLATCYDVRFPELFRAHADEGAVLSVLPASWGAGPSKLDHWRLLTRARALDATLWLAAVGQAPPGPDADISQPTKAPTGIGHSVLVGPDGRVHEEAGETPELIVADVDADKVAKVRKAVAVLDNRRL